MEEEGGIALWAEPSRCKGLFDQMSKDCERDRASRVAPGAISSAAV